ncbi:MAG: hypothetical protein WAX69_19595, partial [Victivallales bacterium]
VLPFPAPQPFPNLFAIESPQEGTCVSGLTTEHTDYTEKATTKHTNYTKKYMLLVERRRLAGNWSSLRHPWRKEQLPILFLALGDRKLRQKVIEPPQDGDIWGAVN